MCFGTILIKKRDEYSSRFFLNKIEKRTCSQPCHPAVFSRALEGPDFRQRYELPDGLYRQNVRHTTVRHTTVRRHIFKPEFIDFIAKADQTYQIT